MDENEMAEDVELSIRPDRDGKRSRADKQVKQLLQTAARWRVRGVSWEEIAKITGRSKSAVGLMKWKYAKLWDRYFDKARQQFLGDVEVKSIETLKELAQRQIVVLDVHGEVVRKDGKVLMAEVDEATRRQAARDVLDYCAKLRSVKPASLDVNLGAKGSLLEFLEGVKQQQKVEDLDAGTE